MIEFRQLPTVDIYKIVDRLIPKHLTFVVTGPTEIGLDREWMSRIYFEVAGLYIPDDDPYPSRLVDVQPILNDIEIRYPQVIDLITPLCSKVTDEYLSSPMTAQTLAQINSDLLQQDHQLASIGRPNSYDLIRHAMGVRRAYW